MSNGKTNKRHEITGVLLFAVAVLLSVSYYIPSAATGLLGQIFLNLGRGLIGVPAYILPAFFVYGALEFLIGKATRRSRRRFFHVSIILIIIASLIQLFAVDFHLLADLSVEHSSDHSATTSLVFIWRQSVSPETVPVIDTNLSGGIIGSFIAYGLEAVAGKTGASIILIAGLLIEAVILFGLSFSRILTKTGEAVNRTAVRVNKSFSRADHPSQRPINSRGFDHVVDAALRRRQAGLDIDGVDRRYDRRRQPTAQPTRGGEMPRRSGTRSQATHPSFYDKREVEGVSEPNMHSPSRSHSSQYVDVNSAQNYAVSTDPLSENNAYEFDKTQPNYRQTYPYRDETVGRSRGDFESQPLPPVYSYEPPDQAAEYSREVLKKGSRTQLTGSDEGFFHVGDAEPGGAVGIDAEELSLLSDFPQWNANSMDQEETERDPLISDEPLFAFDAEGNNRPLILGDEPARDPAMFDVPKFLQPERQPEYKFFDLDDMGDSGKRPKQVDPTVSSNQVPLDEPYYEDSFSSFNQSLYDRPFESEHASANEGLNENLGGASPNQGGVQEAIQGIDENTGQDVEPFDVKNDVNKSTPMTPSKPNHVLNEKASKSLKSAQINSSKTADPRDQAASAVKKQTSSNNRSSAGQDKVVVHRPYVFPSLNLLNQDRSKLAGQKRAVVQDMATKLEDTLDSFGVSAKVINITTGPSITRFELSPGPGVKVSRIVNLADDIALSLAAIGLRIEAPIPGKSAIGIEIPNKETQMVTLRPILEDATFRKATSKLTVALGRDIPGAPVYCDLTKMPHLLIAGATGSGKSVCINSILISLLYKASPEEVKLILVDPKIVELSVYNGIPHLLAPVVTDPQKAANTLNWAVVEMDRRYQEFAERRCRDIKAFNHAVANDPEGEKMPLILIVIDELADLMMTAPSDVEDAIVRLTQKARAAGIHLIIATQRPSVDVITGLIKSNIPSRIAFAVSSQVDSRTILDSGGAEKLLGKGDMLYHPQSSNKPVRCQGALVTDEEVERVIRGVRENNEAQYDAELATEMISTTAEERRGESTDEEEDELLEDAVELFLEVGHASIALLQRRLRIGYPRASRIIDELELKGWVGPFDGSKPRKLLVTNESWSQIKAQRKEDEATIDFINDW